MTTSDLTTPSAPPPDPDDVADNPWVARYLTWAPWVVTVLLLAFVALNVVGASASPTGAAATSDAGPSWSTLARLWILMLLLTLAAVWFIACFTGSAKRKLHHAFVFAYAFTFGAFALLLTPFVGAGDDVAAASVSQGEGRNAAVRPREGVLQLVRGCVRGTDAAQSDAVSAVTRCPDFKHPTLARVENAVPPETAASDRPIAQEMDRHYHWLVSIGGVNARRYQPVFDGPRPLQPDPHGRFEPRQFVEVHGGLTVPLFVVVLAFIGAAVSLSRRIPEYQRRSEGDYKATEAEPAMAAFQARESVVFQIMQLVSAPFLALTTWYIVGPTTLAGAVGLAFITGFLSEHVLLMIRGMAEGIRPATTRTTQPPVSRDPP